MAAGEHVGDDTGTEAPTVSAETQTLVEALQAAGEREAAVLAHAVKLACAAALDGTLEFGRVDKDDDGVIEPSEADDALDPFIDRARDFAELEDVKRQVAAATEEEARLQTVVAEEEAALAALQAQYPHLRLRGDTTVAQSRLAAVQYDLSYMTMRQGRMEEHLGLTSHVSEEDERAAAAYSLHE